MNNKWEGIKYNDSGEPVCAGCGGQEMEVISHVDGDTWYSWTYRCRGCGHTISVKGDRAPEDAKFWGCDN
jgi:hypothetical protein